jgi:hypothetical protein
MLRTYTEGRRHGRSDFLDGEVRPTDETPRFDCDDNGRCEAVGEMDKNVGPFTGYLIHAPGVIFAVVKGNPPGRQALCLGKLWEERHGPTQGPSQAINVGRLNEIWFHPLTQDGEPDGLPIRLYNTCNALNGRGTGPYVSCSNWKRRPNSTDCNVLRAGRTATYVHAVLQSSGTSNVRMGGASSFSETSPPVPARPSQD